MAAWYVGSVQHAAVTQWAAGAAVTIGMFRRQLAAPAVGSERVFRCTTAGTTGGAEPAWTLTIGATTNDNGVVWTEVTGNSTYGWSAASARLLLIFNTWAAAGDTIYVAGNHAETQATGMTLSTPATGTIAAPLLVYCVNASGSVPPVAADLQTTATVSTTGGSFIRLGGRAYIYGITFLAGSGASGQSLELNRAAATGYLKLENCALVLNNTGSNFISINLSATDGTITELVNTPCTFGAVAQSMTYNVDRFIWRNTPNAIQGSVPTTLLGTGGSFMKDVLLEGLDLSAAGAGKTLINSTGAAANVNIVNCKLGAGVTVCATPASRSAACNLVISDSGDTGYRQERFTYEGTLTTETTYVVDGGASDGVTPFSWKVVTTANAKPQFPFACFPIVIWNTTIGSPVIATIEIENGGVTLQDADIWVEFEALKTSGFPLGGQTSSGPATPLTAGANLPTSSVTWNGALGSAVKQYLQATFTPQEVGLIRATVKIARASTTLYINPQIALA